jgi:hypothetical protein
MTRILVVTLMLFLANVSLAEASPIKWTLDGALFDDGTEANGSFIYDADSNTYSNWLISVLNGTLSAFTYDINNSQVGSSHHNSMGVIFIENTGTRYVNFTFTLP